MINMCRFVGQGNISKHRAFRVYKADLMRSKPVKQILAFLLLLLGTQSLFAQDAIVIPPEDATKSPRVLSVIHTVEVVTEDKQPTLLIFGTMPDGCERET